MSKFFKKITLIIFISLSTTLSVASSDGSNDLLKKNQNVEDCFEGVNRSIFAFNQALDQMLIEPISKGFRKLPQPIKTGTSNFVNNISNLVTIPNNILQGDLNAAANNLARLLINTTIGIVGLLDPADGLGFKKMEKEDYGQSLGKMGMGPGCYLVLPILGPSTVRDTFGRVIEVFGGDPFYNITVKKETHHFSEEDYWYNKAAGGIDFRAKNIDSFENLKKNSIDFYASVKSLYLQDRAKKIANNGGSSSSNDENDWEEIELQ